MLVAGWWRGAQAPWLARASRFGSWTQVWVLSRVYWLAIKVVVTRLLNSIAPRRFKWLASPKNMSSMAVTGSPMT